ncbi:hypothetical protein [Kocuria sp. SM24M-10]|uniref:hypothetical protein n=1 Tax=Kocuria sp. SM24M-10 TaxID=1660349 RepID=UPI000A93C1D2|nr:hypothetical protein [Kocuria sp. SM24M-10]
MHKGVKAGTLTAAGVALVIGGLSACSSSPDASGLHQATSTNMSSTDATGENTQMVADLTSSEFLTPERFEARWKISPKDAVYDASRTRYTTAEEFRKAHDGESHKDWYRRVAKKEYASYLEEKIDEIDG